MSKSNAPRDFCSCWASKTFEEAADDTFWKDREIKSKLKEHLKKLKLLNEKVNGYAVRGLEKTHEGMEKGPSFTETFSEVSNETGDCNPIDYLFLLLKKSISMNIESDKITGILARGMRTFPSLLRDRDFASMMEQEIKREKTFGKFEVVNNPMEDTKQHTDVLIILGGKKYRIWLFQYTRRGLPHDIERITGERGSLPEGIHILCPLKSEIAIEYEHIKFKIVSRETRLKKIDKTLKETKKGSKKFEILESRRKNLIEELDELIKIEKNIDTKIKDEVFVCEGWYFYSTEKINAVLNVIKDINDGNLVPETYEKVCEILNAPKKYLSEISSFKV